MALSTKFVIFAPEFYYIKMKKLFFLAISLTLTCCWFTSCKDTQTFADLVNIEIESISTWVNNNPYTEFGHITSWDEEKVNSVTKSILNDSIHPSKYLKLDQWYSIKEGNFKRLYFCIHSWGHDGVTDYNDEAQLKEAMRLKKKFSNGKNILVRYDSLFVLNKFDYENLDKNVKGDNLDPNSFMICYNWNSAYYSTTYYGYSYGSGSSYECTSGGLGFPARFLWDGGKASIICPFSLVETTFAQYYYTLYYGDITYLQPTYLPK